MCVCLYACTRSLADELCSQQRTALLVQDGIKAILETGDGLHRPVVLYPRTKTVQWSQSYSVTVLLTQVHLIFVF
jgi:hypothetical protein